MRATACIILALSLFLAYPAAALAQGGAPPPPFAQSPDFQQRQMLLQSQALERDTVPGEFVLLDALLIRPMGMVALGLGLAGSIVILPMTMLTDSGSIAGKSLIQEPFDFTFRRPLGDFGFEEKR